MLKDTLEKELQELELDADAGVEDSEEELASCGVGTTKDVGHCSGVCATSKQKTIS